MRYEVKAGEGRLIYGSLRELRQLYEQGFVAPDDLVRPVGAPTWMMAGRMPGLREAQAHSRTEATMVLKLAVAIVLSIVVGGLALEYKGVALVGLVLLAMVIPFVVYRRRR